MKFLSTLTFLAAVVSARRDPTRKPLVSRYELSLFANSADAPYSDGAVSLKDNAAGFWASQTEPLVIDVEEDVEGAVQLTIDSGGFLTVDGDGGLRDLVLVGEQQPSDGSGFSLELRDDGERMYNVTWGHKNTGDGKGKWLVQSVGGDDYQLKWWDGEGFTIATVFPVQLVGKLTRQT